jgi:hypothetical protein
MGLQARTRSHQPAAHLVHHTPLPPIGRHFKNRITLQQGGLSKALQALFVFHLSDFNINPGKHGNPL